MSHSLTVDVSPIEELLREQKSLQTPVVDFSNYHDGLASRYDTPKAFSRLMPLTQPEKGHQYAFEVDLDRCTGCKACVAACHQMNGLNDEESWRDVGLLVGKQSSNSYQQTVTTACHHCEEPGCLEGCPVLAYEKDTETGIVRHLDDQCIGCQYCILKCPYDVPKYNEDLGIVRKCDMCYQRLAEGEAPACVQACPTEAIRIVTVDQRQTVESSTFGLLPGAPSSEITKPTTRYVSNRSIPENARAGDLYELKVQPEHQPLVWMLILSQVSFGLLLFSGRSHGWMAFLPLIFMGAGLVASTLHLGRPLGAWRAFLGLRTSWLSREIVAFGNYLMSLAAFATIPLFIGVEGLKEFLWAGSVFCGGVAIFTSVMVYHDTQRKSWNWKISGLKFFGTAIILGGIGAEWLYQVFGGESLHPFGALAGLGLLLKIGLELWQFRIRGKSEGEGFWKTARLIQGPLRRIFMTRINLALFGFASLMMGLEDLPRLTFFGILLIATSEWLERSIFFKSSDAMKMPGGYRV